MMTLDKNGHAIHVPDEKLTEAEKKEKMYSIDTDIPLVVERGSYIGGAKTNINYPYASMGTPININIVSIRGYEVKGVMIYVDDKDAGRYLNENEYTIQDDGIRTKIVSFIMPMANVKVSIELKREEEE